MKERHELIIIGGGLAGSVLALELARRQPELDVLLIEAGPNFGGDHVWSFFDADVSTECRTLIEPAILRRWGDHEVRFPRFRRQLCTGYNSVTSTLLDRTVRRVLPASRYILHAPVAHVAPTEVQLSNGRCVEAQGVIDARGASELPGVELAWQVFVGCQYQFPRPHGLVRPIIMDATVEQGPGYRFIYCLPFTAHGLLVEETCYTLDSRLEEATLRARIDGYVTEQGFGRGKLLRMERGILPIALGGDIAAQWNTPLPQIGLRGGFFHPTTGYSLPDALHVATLIGKQRDLDSSSLHRTLAQESKRLWRERRFCRLLNRLLFHAASPRDRVKVFEHFYRLDPALISRFYAGRLCTLDRLRILSGRPPVPVLAALSTVLGCRRRDVGECHEGNA